MYKKWLYDFKFSEKLIYFLFNAFWKGSSRHFNWDNSCIEDMNSFLAIPVIHPTKCLLYHPILIVQRALRISFYLFFFSPKQGKFNSYVVQVFPRKHDNLLKYTPACRQYRREWNKYMNSSKIQRINHEHRHLFQYSEKHSGTPICTIGDVKYLHDTLSTEKYLNKTYVHFTLVTNKN